MTKKEELESELAYLIFILKANVLLKNLEEEYKIKHEKRVEQIKIELKDFNENNYKKEIPIYKQPDYQEFLEYQKNKTLKINKS